ncbi:hypothetical protein [Dongia sp.]|uniref:hypothetical protein n=1 Tax=Dongia sp. TaxID=1977262 RepID=UPI0035AFB80A
MNTRLLLGALAATMLVSGTAMAASTPAEKCTALIGQWNDVAKTHKDHAKFAAAEKDAKAGEKACHGNKAADGVKDLTKALNLIGVKPTV